LTCALLSFAFIRLHSFILDIKLINAVKQREIARARQLLLSGASLEARDTMAQWRTTNFTPLALAIYKNDMPMVRMLLARGANLNSTDNDGRSVPRDIIMNTAVEKADVDIVRLLLDSGAHVDAHTGMNVTPLMLAARDNRVNVVTLLIARGADVRAKDDRGFTPMSFARARSKTDRSRVIRLLLNAGARQ